MTPHDAIDRACAEVGIVPPPSYQEGRWTKTDTLEGRSGKGDGRIMVDEGRVTSWNWQTGEKATVFMDDSRKPDRQQFARAAALRREEDRARAARAAAIAQDLVRCAKLKPHGYLAAKGFASERGLVIGADAVREIGGRYLVPDGARTALVVPARIGDRLTSAQLIWEGGEKRFLAGGEMGGACHRLSKGTDAWLCEGLATGMSLRAALRGLGRSDTVIVGFSASNLPVLARTIRGRCFIAADNDGHKPQERFDGLGTGEHYARESGRPYAMPERLGDDFNDVHQDSGIFAVQRHLADLIRRGTMQTSGVAA